MSAELKLSSKLPADPAINGMDSMAAALAANPKTIVCALVWLDVAKVESYPDVVPTVRVRKIEPLGAPADVPPSVVELAQHREALRTGREPLPFAQLEPDSGRSRPVDDGCDHVDVQLDSDGIEGVPEGMVRESCLRCGLQRYLPADEIDEVDDATGEDF